MLSGGLERSAQVSDNADEFLRVTDAGIEFNMARRLEPRAEVDTYFGICWWIQLSRHLIFQDGLSMAIDYVKVWEA